MNEIIRKLTGLPMTALIISLAFMGIVIFFYKIVYKKLLKGQKDIALTKLLAVSFLAGYMLILLLLTIFRGGASFSYAANFSLFSSYIAAANALPDTSSLWLLIFNIGMFIPLGFLLPFASSRFNSFGGTFMFALCATYIIEAVQYMTGMGIFEIDDMLNNLLGAVIGFAISRIFLYKKTKNNIKPKTENLTT